MQPSRADERTTSPLGSWSVALAVAGTCWLVTRPIPGASAILAALVIGCIAANTDIVGSAARRSQAAAARTMLRLGVVVVGYKLSVQSLASLGLGAVLVATATVAATYAATVFVGTRLGIDRGLVTLVAAGFSVCGAAAIAAVESRVRRRDQDVGLAVAMVTVFGTLMIVVVPAAGRWSGMTDRQVAVWAGASIHEVAQVVAAGSSVGVAALAVATTVKLVRVATLPAVYLVSARRHGTSTGGKVPVLPWFVVGFLGAAALRSSGVLPDAVLAPTDTAATILLASGMYGLGLGLRARELFPVPTRLLVLCLASTATAAAVSWLLTVGLV